MPLIPKNIIVLKVISITVMNLFVGIWTNAIAQIDTTLYIKEIKISESPLEKTAGGSLVQSFQTNQLQRSSNLTLAGILSQNNAAFIKSYGSPGLATISLRGTGSNHTSVIWNGVNLQSPMNGTVDFNLIPAYLLESAALQKGSGSARYGSGTVGGSVLLNSNNKPDVGWRSEIGSAMGSFGQLDFFGQINYGTKKTGLKLKAIHRQADNDFKIPEKRNRRQSNAQMHQYGLTADAFFQINKNQSLHAYGWYLKTDRELPPALGASVSESYQLDEQVRGGLEWKKIGDDQVTKIRASFVEDHLDFFSSLNELSQSTTRLWQLDGEHSFYGSNNWSLQTGIQQQIRYGEAIELGGIKRENRTGLWSALQKESNDDRFLGSFQMRLEQVDGRLIPVTGSLGGYWRFLPQFKWRIKTARVYNLPTFNDLFWTDGIGRGNPDLKPEDGWSHESGIEWQSDQWMIRATAFSSRLSNWILWLPTANFWQPENKRSVWSRGIDAEVIFTKNFGASSIQFNGNYQYTRSTVEAIDENNNPNQLGKQLLYVPAHTAGVGAQWEWKNTRVHYTHQFVGERETTRDNNPLFTAEMYQIGQFSIHQTIPLKSINLLAHLSVNNIWNENYKVVAFRPMPGRNGEIGLRINL